MKLNFRLNNSLKIKEKTPIVLIHGLFGNLDNLGMLSRDLQKNHTVILLDLRNHGLSPRSQKMNYTVMAQDVLELLVKLQIDKVIIIGHSIGGKVAMMMKNIAPQNIEKVIVIDIAPVAYALNRHDAIFTALKEVIQQGIVHRPSAARLMRQFISEAEIIYFLLKSFKEGKWCFDVEILYNQYKNLADWQSIPASLDPILFIRGERSSYIKDSYRNSITEQFPQAFVKTIAQASHAVHAEKTAMVLDAIRLFIYN